MYSRSTSGAPFFKTSGSEGTRAGGKNHGTDGMDKPDVDNMDVATMESTAAPVLASDFVVARGIEDEYSTMGQVPDELEPVVTPAPPAVDEPVAAE